MKSSSSVGSTDPVIREGDVPSPAELGRLVGLNRRKLQQTVQKLSKSNPRRLDDVVHSLHGQAFGFYDCLACANCCRTISPAISHNDVDQLAKKLRKKPSELVVSYLKTDEDGDYVFHRAPCPFIDDENRCSVYSHRPKACREYPHTDRSRFYQLLKLSLKNAEICPVVYTILMKLG